MTLRYIRLESRVRCIYAPYRVVVGRSIKIKGRIDDQTIVDNCQISKMKISTLKVLLAVF